MKILSKKAIRELKAVHKMSPLHHEAFDMAEKYRQIYRQRRRDARRRPKTHLKPTDYLTQDQFAELIQNLSLKDTQRSRMTKEIIILLAETGLRCEEAIELRYRDIPVYHGHNEIAIRKGKGRWKRTVIISGFMADRIRKNKRLGWTKNAYYLINE